MKLLILLFTLGSGLSVWHAVSSYSATAHLAGRYKAAKREDARLRRLCTEWRERASTPSQRQKADAWYEKQVGDYPFQGGPSISRVINGTWDNNGRSEEYVAFSEMPDKRKEAWRTGLGGLCGMMAGLLGLLL